MSEETRYGETVIDKSLESVLEDPSDGRLSLFIGVSDPATYQEIGGWMRDQYGESRVDAVDCDLYCVEISEHELGTLVEQNIDFVEPEGWEYLDE